MNKSILTIATGKPIFIEMAVNLARSFFYWHPDTDITFRLVTDRPDQLPADIRSKIDLLVVSSNELGLGFSVKLKLDQLATDGQTLFIDSDCLIYGKLDWVFEKFKGHSVSVIGNYINKGEWFGDIQQICRQFNVTHIPKFNGGVYYLEKGEMADRVYQTARDLETRYDEIGLVRLRNLPNDELLMALAMELNQQTPIADDGFIMAEFVNFKCGIKSDLLNGFAELYNNPDDSRYQQNWHLQLAKPSIVHFLGYHNQIMPYIKEVKHLEYVFAKKLPVPVAKSLAYFKVALPAKTKTYIKNTLRPVYHLVFGARKIKRSERMAD